MKKFTIVMLTMLTPLVKKKKILAYTKAHKICKAKKSCIQLKKKRMKQFHKWSHTFKSHIYFTEDDSCLKSLIKQKHWQITKTHEDLLK